MSSRRVGPLSALGALLVFLATFALCLFGTAGVVLVVGTAGSVNVGAIAAMLDEKGFSIEEKNIRLAQPLKEVGVHSIPVHVRHDVRASVRLVLSAVGQPPADTLPPKPKPEPKPEPQPAAEAEGDSGAEEAVAEEGAEAP